MTQKIVSNMDTLTKADAVCVILRQSEGVGVMCYDNGAVIRTYLPDEVDWRWSGPLLTTAAEVLTHLGQSEKPCSVPVKLAQQLFHWSMPFANLPT